LLIIILLVQNPDRALKLKALILEPLFRWFRWGARAYLAAKVGSSATEFLQKHVTSVIPSANDVELKIRWVKSPSDPVFTRQGTLLLRIRETNDQTRNIMAATRVALPHIVCPLLRKQIEKYAESAIDLALLRKLAERLGRNARPLFKRYFLEPEVEEDERAADLFRKLLVLDDSGMFAAIFLEELNVLGDRLYEAADATDKTNDIVELLEFLLPIAKRGIGQHVPLDFRSAEFNMAVVLLAKSEKAKHQGVHPYVQMIQACIRRGCDTIHLIAYPGARSFLNRVLKALASDERITIAAATVPVRRRRGNLSIPSANQIALLRRNNLFADLSFSDRLSVLGIHKGGTVEGRVVDVASDKALVDIQGVNGIISRQECSWQTIRRCSDLVSSGSKYRFVVKDIDATASLVELSLRFPDTDPWKSERLPKVGDIIQVDVVALEGQTYYSHYADGIEVVIPRHELSWFDVRQRDEGIVGAKIKVRIYERNEHRRTLKGSPRRVDKDPWPKIHARFPKGTELRARVLEVSPTGVKVALPDGFSGIIPAEAMKEGRYEYADFQNNVVPGQGLEVVVTKVFIARRKIRLALKRTGHQT
jgi:hypothetical protein